MINKILHCKYQILFVVVSLALLLCYPLKVFGFIFATLVTMGIVPILYALFFKVGYDREESINSEQSSTEQPKSD